jgi:formylglycine-generating enzyme required for sulfatase activity
MTGQRCASAWSSRRRDQGIARSAVRGWDDPGSRFVVVGFRVLCSSPIFEH